MPHRLVLRIYLIGLAQIAALVITLALARDATRPHNLPHAAETQMLLEALLRDPSTLQAHLTELHANSNIEVQIRDAGGKEIASTGPMHPQGPGTTTLQLSTGTALVHLPPPQHPNDGGPFLAIGATLVLVGISALLTASWLARPLAKLSEAARSLGQGNLTARANLNRSDELGQVSQAFDEMAERVEQLVKGQRELLANVSHELRTPLARIRIALDLAAEGDARELPLIAQDLAELERLTNDILASARLELSSGVPPLRLEKLSARELLQDVTKRFQTAHPQRILQLDDETSGAALHADRMLLRRALDNLLDNAVKHSEQVIELQARSEHATLAIDIIDKGSGIAEGDLAKLFTPFFRADRSRDRKSGGLGLGLVLAKRIVEAHGGTLKLESQLGAGTTAKLRVPIASQS